MHTIYILGLAASVWLAAGPPSLRSQDHQHHEALNKRGKAFMGFDQEAATHRFVLMKDGGRIEVTARKAGDEKSIAEIRTHLRHIADVFKAGDFSIPAQVHDREVPGVEKLKQAGEAVTYGFEEIDRGGFVRMVAATPSALAAIHEFLRFQIKDHGTGDPLIVK